MERIGTAGVKMSYLSIDRTDNFTVHIHGFGESAFNSLPGKPAFADNTVWKKMVFGDVEIVFVKDGKPEPEIPYRSPMGHY